MEKKIKHTNIKVQCSTYYWNHKSELLKTAVNVTARQTFYE